MELEGLALQETNKVMQAYHHDKEFLHTFFDYENDHSAYTDRLEELANRKFKRRQLSDIVRTFMDRFGISEQAEQHIAELADDAVVVIGGQQAGILTGPLYSVHKAITVILLAKKKRAELGIPVVPVFWVAGEDHDLNEINHVFTELDGRAVKHQIQEKFVLKLMASDASYNKEQMASFVKNIFGKYGETIYTKELLNEVLEAVGREQTFTQFFVRLMNGMFKDEGLLFIDSAFQPLRKLESDYFVRMIEEAGAIAEKVFNKEAHFAEIGFGTPIQSEMDAAHLFYVHETGRVLLKRKDGFFVNDSTGLRFSKDEMLHIANNEPWLLSNNVATRPLMQDLVFPVLAFVGGPGEIAYWALLKEAFHHLQMRMPIIAPRMSITLVTPQVQRALKGQGFTVEDVMSGKVFEAKEEFAEGLKNPQFEALLQEAENLLTEQFRKIEEIANGEELMMQGLLEKNLQFHIKQLNYLKGKAEETTVLKHTAALRIYSLLEGELFPEGVFQERLYTPYAYMNTYGPLLIQELCQLPFEMDGTHKIIYL